MDHYFVEAIMYSLSMKKASLRGIFFSRVPVLFGYILSDWENSVRLGDSVRMGDFFCPFGRARMHRSSQRNLGRSSVYFSSETMSLHEIESFDLQLFS